MLSILVHIHLRKKFGLYHTLSSWKYPYSLDYRRSLVYHFAPHIFFLLDKLFLGMDSLQSKEMYLGLRYLYP